ncbi:MAG: SRPBCC family protein [Balneolaceae bacterium]|nr:SRPBCC family protein [Balneolaceae bacterium]
MITLKKALLANALFSSASGILLILFHDYAAQLFGAADTHPFWITGLLLLLFALSVFVEVRRQRLTNILIIILQDGLWVLGSALLLVLQPFGLTAAGYWIIGVVAVVVLFFGAAQSLGVLRADSVAGYARKILEFERRVPAGRSEVWEEISKVSDYHRVAPNIDRSELLSGETRGEGMVRMCAHGDSQWTETCTDWQEQERYSFEVDTAAPDYPYPFTFLKGTWIVESDSPDNGRGGSTIRMRFEFDYGNSVYAFLLHPFIRNRFEKVCEELLDNWEQALVRNEKQSAPA